MKFLHLQYEFILNWTPGGKKNSGTFSMMHQIVLLGNKSIQQEDQFGIITVVIA